jgi:hypothetical protein
VREHLVNLWKWLALTACLALAPSTSRADVIFSTFGPGDTFQCCIGYTVSGLKSPVGEELLTANEFTSTGNFALTQIDLGFGWVTGTNSFTVTLNADANGQPGAVLETWELDNAQQFGSQTGPETLMSVGNVHLTSANYWIVIGPLNPPDDMWGAWNLDSTGQIGTVAQMTDNGGWNVFPGTTLSAFDVLGKPAGVVPEPATLLLLGSGLVGLLARCCR